MDELCCESKSRHFHPVNGIPFVSVTLRQTHTHQSILCNALIHTDEWWKHAKVVVEGAGAEVLHSYWWHYSRLTLHIVPLTPPPPPPPPPPPRICGWKTDGYVMGKLTSQLRILDIQNLPSVMPCSN